MAAVIIGALIMGVFLMIQGFHVLRTGNPPGFGMRPVIAGESWPKMNLYGRISTGLLFVVPGIAVLLLLTRSLLHSDKSLLIAWISGHVRLLLVALTTLFIGLFSFFKAQTFLRSMKASNPAQYRDEDDDVMLLMFRIIGCAFVIGSFWMLGHFSQ